MAEHDILIVDDEPVVTGAARRILGAEGYSLDLAVDRQTCLERVRSNRYRLVLCDLMLPGVRGFELVSELQEHQPGVPVVMISGYATSQNAVGAFKTGAFDFIPKPFDMAELLGVTRRALDFERAGGGVLAPRRAYALGGHAWVVIDTKGQARIGLGETFAVVAGRLDAVQLPGSGDDLLQGNTCIRMVTHDQLIHRLWAPLSGRVIATNDRAAAELTGDAPGAICGDWLVAMLPSDPEHELSQLTRSASCVGERAEQWSS